MLSLLQPFMIFRALLSFAAFGAVQSATRAAESVIRWIETGAGPDAFDGFAAGTSRKRNTRRVATSVT